MVGHAGVDVKRRARGADSCDHLPDAAGVGGEISALSAPPLGRRCAQALTSDRRREGPWSDSTNSVFARFWVFYSPLMATMAAGFLKAGALPARHSVSAPGKSAIAGLVDGKVDVAQSAPSQGFAALEQGKPPPALHFAQINERDGFFLTGRQPDPAFTWSKLKGRRGIVAHGGPTTAP